MRAPSGGDPRLFAALADVGTTAQDPLILLAALRELAWQAHDAKVGREPLSTLQAQALRAMALEAVAGQPQFEPLKETLDSLPMDTAKALFADPRQRHGVPAHDQGRTQNLYVTPSRAPVTVIVQLDSPLSRATVSGRDLIEVSLLENERVVAQARLRNLVTLCSGNPAGRNVYALKLRNLSAEPLWISCVAVQGLGAGCHSMRGAR